MIIYWDSYTHVYCMISYAFQAHSIPVFRHLNIFMEATNVELELYINC